MRLTETCGLCIVCLTCVIAAHVAAVPPSFVGIGDLPGDSFSSGAGAVSGDGRVVIASGWTAAGSEGAMWTAAAGIVSMAPGNPTAANANGTVIVGRRNGPARWTAATGWVNIQSFGEARDTSSDGSVVVGSYNIGSTEHPYRWTTSGGMQTLNIPNGASGAAPIAVSGDGGVIVGVARVQSTFRAFIWTAATGSHLLPPTPSGQDIGRANAVSADGTTVVGIADSTFAYRWNDEDGAVALGSLGPSIRTEAMAVSGKGEVIVGNVYESGHPAGAFIWDEVRGIRDLQTMLTSELGLNLSGWTVSSARGISDDGFVIVGDGINPLGSPEGWVVTVPTPSSALMLLAGIPLLMRRRR